MVGTPLVMGLALFTMDVAKIASFYLSFVLFQAAFQLTAATAQQFATSWPRVFPLSSATVTLWPH